MNKEQISAVKEAQVDTLGYKWAKELRLSYPKHDVKEIAQALGAEILYEKPVEMVQVSRISEYRVKTKQIVIFYREFERTAIAHELFHHLEKIRDVKLKGPEAETQAEIFSSHL